MIEYVYNTRKLKLSMTKKDAIHITLENQRTLFDCYDSISEEIIKLLDLRK